MRILPQSSDRNDVNNMTIYKTDNKDKNNKNNLKESKGIKIKIDRKLLIIIGFGLLILAVIVVCLIVLLNHKKKTDQESEGFLINNGYFYPVDDKNNLHKCSTRNCQRCYGYIEDNYCNLCFTNSTPVYTGNIISDCFPKSEPGPPSPITQKVEPGMTIPEASKPKTTIPVTTIPIDLCIQGKNEKCLKCNESKDKCLKCNSGYFLPEDSETQLECLKCPIKNCQQCLGTSTSPNCLSCEKYSIPNDETDIKACTVKLGDGPLCKNIDSGKNECTECNDGYLYEEGKCILNYNIKAIFKTRTKNENIKLIQKFYQYIEEMTIDGNKLAKPVKTYTFENKGEHIVYYKMRIPDNGSLNGIFEGLNKMISVSFSENMELENITQMNRMFYNCQNLQSIDLSHLNTKNVDIMNYMFYQCLTLDNIDLSEVESSKVKDISNMFENCVSVKNIDISNFTNDKIETKDMFKGIPDNGNIIVNENLKNKINNLIPNWNIVTK